MSQKENIISCEYTESKFYDKNVFCQSVKIHTSVSAYGIAAQLPISL